MSYMINRGGKKYVFTNIERISFTKASPTSTISFPGQERQEVIKMEGITISLNLSWKIKEESNDVSEGTNSTPVKTIEEQVIYLLSSFVTSDISLDYEVEVYIDTMPSKKFRGIVESISLNQAGGEPFFSGNVSIVVTEIV